MVKEIDKIKPRLEEDEEIPKFNEDAMVCFRKGMQDFTKEDGNIGFYDYIFTDRGTTPF